MTSDPLDVLVVEPYFVDSHAAWVDGWAAHSVHQLTAITRPGDRWRDRLRHASIDIADEIVRRDLTPDVLVASSMTNLSQLVAIVPQLRTIPSMVMMHENHVAYPDRDVSGSPRPTSSEFASITTSALLTAEAIVWNSDFHQRIATSAIRKHAVCSEAQLEGISDRSITVPIGIAPDLLSVDADPRPNTSPLILWNHRWDHDKGPQDFFSALRDIEDLDWRLAVVGRNTRMDPREFRSARQRHTDRIEEWGWVPRPRYLELLRTADFVVSTAYHEFFGIAVAEAVASGAIPLLPNDLAYREVIPAEYHPLALDDDDLAERLRDALENVEEWRHRSAGLAAEVQHRFGWPRIAARLDRIVDRLRV